MSEKLRVYFEVRDKDSHKLCTNFNLYNFNQCYHRIA